jgi:hypothetical protein
MKTRLLLTVLVACSGLVACGGDPKEAKAPESNSGITETSAKEDMPPAPAKEADPHAAPAPAATPEPATGGGAAGGMIKVAAMKLTPAKKGANAKAVELKADGTITVDGKPAAKIKGDQVDSIGGTSMLTVGVDGSLVGNGVQPGYKFDGDDVTTDSGAKLSVGDDGTITMNKDGKSDVVGKAEGGGSAKRAALIMSILYLTMPADKKAPAAKPPAATKTSTPATKK